MTLFTILLLILFLTAIVDLIVGVSNDAVNFLNSAIGSRVASFRTILIVSSCGILLGTTFSSGMMEIARNGLFNPGYFTFQEVIYIFLAVMLTDIILLDIYNNLGLPTSTTVSLIFELLGAAFVAGILTSLEKQMGWSGIQFKEILNFSSAITIVVGIFLSVFLAFFVGTFVQHVSRILFTFSLKKSLQKYGAIFSGLAITTIFYFLLIKGAKGSSFVSDDQVKWIMANSWTINFVSLIFWSILIQVMMWWTAINPLRIVVLLGTFALAMAFAGNDLVNFIGVAVGGYIAFNAWSSSGVAPDQFNMSILKEEFTTPTWMLLLAGGIMIITLWTNAKSRKVTDTEVSLGRQEEGEEKFKPTWVSRMLVGGAINLGRWTAWAVPKSWSKYFSGRFSKENEKDKDKASFDLVRASVNLLVSSTLIAFGTSQKLPLSTTFVTFMVAMGSSFADQAWGRESAVYRVAGVMNVIAGWLITAVIAFSSSAILVFIIFKTESAGVFILTGLAAFLLVRSHVLFDRRQKAEVLANQIFSDDQKSLSQSIDEIKEVTIKNIKLAAKVYSNSLEALIKEKKGSITKSAEQVNQLAVQNDKLQGKIIKYVRKMPKENLAASRLYLMMFDHLQDLYQSVQLISESCINHLANFHGQPSKEFIKAIELIEKKILTYLSMICNEIGDSSFKNQEVVKEQYAFIQSLIITCLDREIIEIQKGEVGNKIGLLQTKLLLETRDLLTTTHSMYSLYSSYHRES
jgi:phosphate/sulfate permease